MAVPFAIAVPGILYLLMQHGLVDEFHLLMTPVAVGRGQHLFEAIDNGPALKLAEVKRFSSGVVLLVYTPS